MPAPAPIIKGIATLIWGTQNGFGTITGAIIESISADAKNQEPIEIEDGQGFAAVQVLLDDGFNAKVTMVYDTSKTWPAVGDTVALNLPKYGAAGGTQSYACLVGSFSTSQERKKETTITVNLTYRPGIVLTP